MCPNFIKLAPFAPAH